MKDSNKHVQLASQEVFKTLSKEEQQAIEALNAIKAFPKGSILIKEGQIPTSAYYVMTGLVRKFKIDEAGKEITIDFFAEDEDVFSAASLINALPSTFNLECIEDSRVSVVSFEKQEEMYRRFPRFERMCREATEINLLAYQERFSNYISWSPEQRYLDLLSNRADLLDRVPQYQLASYLGVKPESLSRIRKRISDRS